MSSYEQFLLLIKLITNTQLYYDRIVNDKKLLSKHILEFKQKIYHLIFSLIKFKSQEFQKEVFELILQQKYFQCIDILKWLLQWEGRVFNYFWEANQFAKERVTLTKDDFNPQLNMTWDTEKEQRGSHYHRYDYYFPRNFEGFGLNTKNYGPNQDWIQMDVNPEEWIIMQHGNSIVRNNFIGSPNNDYSFEKFTNEFNRGLLLGNGMYFR
ncbi:unnamed protein product [Paramecium sonneborni]|uniref:Uncharacterized protein n=1 Tax=Paramecium sonneborni TaxID=65129 RepID=A0A8S1MQL5_9CILI|nr:unnamed protein product [Paramecium sonneborni]